MQWMVTVTTCRDSSLFSLCFLTLLFRPLQWAHPNEAGILLQESLYLSSMSYQACPEVRG